MQIATKKITKKNKKTITTRLAMSSQLQNQCKANKVEAKDIRRFQWKKRAHVLKCVCVCIFVCLYVGMCTVGAMVHAC